MVYYGYETTKKTTKYEPYIYDYKNSPDIVREKAAFIVLARNSDLDGLRNAMRNMEDRFNKNYHYPWVFLNDEPFDEKFKEYTTGLSSGKTYYGQLTHEMWSYPEWIDQDKARQCREKMDAEGVIYGGLESYRHMCR
jgi:alpha 1,2-mannosyltransferase